MQFGEQMRASGGNAVPSPLGLGPDDAFRSSVIGWGIVERLPGEAQELRTYVGGSLAGASGSKRRGANGGEL